MFSELVEVTTAIITKTTTTTIRLTPHELSHIQKKADEAGITRNQYIVNMAVSNTPTVINPRVLCALRETVTLLSIPRSEMTEDMMNNLRKDVEFICQMSLGS